MAGPRWRHRARRIPRDYLRETSFAHMTRRATEARSAGVGKWIGDHVKNKHRYTHTLGGAEASQGAEV